MKRNLLLAVGLVLVVLIVGAGATACYQGYVLPEGQDSSSLIWSQQNTGIWVTGEGKVTVVPDVATLNLGVEAEAKTVTEAQEQAKEAMIAVIDELEGHGVAEKDITTQYYNIYPVRSWDNGQEILIGYRVTNMVTAKIRQIDDTGIIIDAVTRVGGDYIRINGISFTVDDPTAYYGEAREKAMADAEAKAGQLAALAGVTLGKPIYISEGSGYIPVVRDYYSTAEGVPEPTTPISPGEMEISLTVQVVYSIK